MTAKIKKASKKERPIRASEKLRATDSSGRNKLIAVGVVLLVVAAGYAVINTKAAGFFASFEPETGSLSGNAQLVNDTSAYGGKAVQFTAPVSAPDPTPPPSPVGSKPGPSNTGVPAGTKLTVVNGDVTLSTAGQVYDAKDVKGCITVAAANVTIKRSRISCNDYYPVEVTSGNLIIEDTEIVSSGGFATSGVAFSNYVARRLNVHGGADGLKAQSNVLIEGCWIHDLWLKPSDHADSIQQDGGGTNVTIHGNYLDAVDHGFGHGGSYNAAIQVDKGKSTNFVVDANWIDAKGSGYGINLRTLGGTGDKITNNRFGAGTGLPIYTEGSVTISGNVWDATGAAVK